MEFRIYLCFIIAIVPELVVCDSIIKRPTPQAVREGGEVIFECSTDKGDAEILAWYRAISVNSDELIFNTNDPTYDETKYEMIIDESGIEKVYNLKILSAIWEDGAAYKCKLLLSNVHAAASLVVFLEPRVSFVATMIEDDEYNITCSAEYGGPLDSDMDPSALPYLRTVVAGTPGNPEFRRDPGKPDEFPATLTQVSKYIANSADDFRNVTCFAATTTSEYGAARLLDIQFAVKEIQIIPKEQTEFEPGNTLNCTAKGNPAPTFEWRAESSNFPVSSDGPVLQIVEQMIGDNIWKCVARNTAPGSEAITDMHTFEVKAHIGPEPTEEPSTGGGGTEPWIIATATVVPLVVIGAVAAVFVFVLVCRKAPKEKERDDEEFEEEIDPEPYDEYKIRPPGAPEPSQSYIGGQGSALPLDPNVTYAVPKKKPVPYPRSHSQEYMIGEQPRNNVWRTLSQEYLDSHYPKVLPTPGDLNQQKTLTGSADLRGSDPNMSMLPPGAVPLSLIPHDGESAV